MLYAVTDKTERERIMEIGKTFGIHETDPEKIVEQIMFDLWFSAPGVQNRKKKIKKKMRKNGIDKNNGFYSFCLLLEDLIDKI